MGTPMLKPSTLARMRLAAAGALVVAGGLAGCGKEQVAARSGDPHEPTFISAHKDAGTEAGPRPDPCPACGMG